MQRELLFIESLSEDEQLYWIGLLNDGFNLVFAEDGAVHAIGHVPLVNAARAGKRPDPDQYVIRIDPEKPPTASNLRIGSTRQQRLLNRPHSITGLKGVTEPKEGVFRVCRPRGPGDSGTRHLGMYASMHQAAQVYDTYVCENLHEDGYLNFPEQPQRCDGTCVVAARPVLPGKGGYRGKPAQCGTIGGYGHHRKRGESACDSCKNAWAEHARSRRQQRLAELGRHSHGPVISRTP